MDDVKKIIRGLLTSSPVETEIRKLSKDYYEITGENIPYESYGYRSLEDLLRGIPDVVQVYGTGPNATLKVVFSSKSAHIDELVTKQKLPDPRRSRNRRPPKPRRHTASRAASFHRQPPSQPFQFPVNFPVNLPTFNPAVVPPNYIYNYIPGAQKRFVPLPRYDAPPRFNPSLQCNLPPPPGHYTTPPRYNSRSTAPSVKQKSSPNATSTPTTNNLPSPPSKSKTPEPIPKSQSRAPVSLEDSPSPVSPRTADLKADAPSPSNIVPSLNGQNTGAIPKQKANASPQESPKTSPEQDFYFSDHDGYLSDGDLAEDWQECLAEEERINYNVPYAVQENLKKLISHSDKGIWCAEMPAIYLKMFRKPLDYAEYGYRSLIQMCMGLENIFHYHRPDNGDFLLFDKTKPMPTNILQNLREVACFKTKFDYRTSEMPTEPALVGAEELMQDSLDDNYPPEVVRLGEEIPRQFLPENVKELDWLDVAVGEVYDPSKFWILLKEHSKELDRLMDEMQTFYTSFEVSKLEIPEHMIKLGLYCVANYNREYHRAIIVNKTFEKTKVKVFYADYGTIANVNCKGLLFLHRKFASLPFQGIRARLASIWPPTASSLWSPDTSSRFLDLVRNKNLCAQIFRINKDKRILEIFLADTTTDKDVYMNDALVAEGLALFTNQEQEKKPLHPRKIPKYKHMHLKPTFDDIEQGNAPSAAEFLRLVKSGIQEVHLFPNYYVEVESEEGLANDEDFLKSQKKLAEIQKAQYGGPNDECSDASALNDPSVPATDWTELCEEEEEIAGNGKGTISMTLSSTSEEPSTTPESLISPGHQILATTGVKPPPGFEGVKPNFHFNASSINVGNVGNAQNINVGSNNADALLLLANRANVSRPMVTTVMAPPVVMTTQPVNFVTQQVIDPALLVQNPTQNDLLQQLAFSRMLNLQAQQQTQQSYQNVLLSQQNPLLFAQQQNPLIFQQQNPLLMPQTSWNNPNPSMYQQPNPAMYQQQPNHATYQQQSNHATYQQQPNHATYPQQSSMPHNPFANQRIPGSNCLVAEQREQLQKYVHKHLMNGNKDLLNHLGNILKFQDDKMEGFLFKIIFEVISNPSTTISYYDLEIAISKLLNLLIDSQIIDLATRQLGLAEERVKTDNVTTPSTTSHNASTTDVLVRLMSQSSISSQVPSVNNNSQNSHLVKNDRSVEVQTDLEVHNTKNESRRKLVIQTALENQSIRIISFKDNLYVPVNDILQFTVMKPPIDMIRKLVIMSGDQMRITDIRLNEHKDLAEELSRYKIIDSTVHVVPVTCIPKVTKILGVSENSFNSFDEFLKAVDVNSDLWLTS